MHTKPEWPNIKIQNRPKTQNTSPKEMFFVDPGHTCAWFLGFMVGPMDPPKGKQSPRIFLVGSA